MPVVSNGLYRLFTAVVLSMIFTIALFYLTFEIPHTLDRMLRNYYPDVYWDYKLQERILKNLKPYGYLALTSTLILVVAGFTVKRGYISFLGSVTMYIPVFGYFAFAMFFLAGIGVLRVLWLPFLELSPETLKLGHIVLSPFFILKLLPYEHYYYGIVLLIAIAIIGLGLIIFSLGVTTWLYGKFRGCRIVDFWIYKYSRHPQYLGFLLWSYGLLVLTSFKMYVRGALTTPPTLPWLVSSTIVVGIALQEEIEMSKYSKEYMNYREKTPFMIPLPKVVSNIITLPSRLVVRGSPRSIKSVMAILTLYTIILVIASFILVKAFNL